MFNNCFKAKTYPAGTRMNWVTWAPIYPEENDLETADYGNGPGTQETATLNMSFKLNNQCQILISVFRN